MKRKLQFLLLLLLSAVFLNLPLKIYSQSEEVKEAIDALSKMTSAGSDQTDFLLKQASFHVPASLEKTWNGFSPYKKIEIAYWSAETTGNGKKFLAFITSQLKVEFESVTYERSLKSLLTIKVNPVEKLFSTVITSFKLPPTVPKEIADMILTISQYTESQGAAGTRGILKYHFGLADSRVINILRESASNYEVLITGINEAPIPPSQKERIRRVVLELRETLESASIDTKLLEILGKPEFIKAKPGNALKTPIPAIKLKTQYDQFVKKTHTSKDATNFKQMKVNAEGFGGVIFGNHVTTKGLGKIKNIIWIHNKKSKDPTKIGTLKFVFQDSSIKTISNVLWEDVYAAYNIIYVDNINSGDINKGIGLTGASYPDVYNEDKVYDSLVKSNHLTQNEMAYYNFRCQVKKNSLDLTNRYTSNLKQLDRLERQLRYKDSMMADEVTSAQLYKSISAEMSQQHLRNAREYYFQWRQDSALYAKAIKTYFRDTLTYKNYSKKYDQDLNEWKKKDSLAVEAIDTYLSKINKIILYPVVANLELGRSLIRADVLPRNGSILINIIETQGATEGEIKICKQWLEGSDSIGWKFTDDSLFIIADGEKLDVTRQDSLEQPYGITGHLNFNKINTEKGKTISTDFSNFKQVNPVLARIFYDYHRLDNFAKIMAIFRWAKKNGAKFLNKPAIPPLYKAPAYSILLKDGSAELVDMK